MNETSPAPLRSSHRNVFILAVILVAVVILGVWWVSMNDMPGGTSDSSVKAVEVMYTPEGFSPREVTVKQGQTVTFLQGTADAQMWVASDDHPEHAGYAGTPMEEHCPDASGLKFDQCSSGVSYSFTFQKTGTWGYHNHQDPDATGVVTVTQ